MDVLSAIWTAVSSPEVANTSLTNALNQVIENAKNGPFCSLWSESSNITSVSHKVFPKLACGNCAQHLELAGDRIKLPDASKPFNVSLIESGCFDVSPSKNVCQKWLSCCLDAIQCCSLQTSQQNISSPLGSNCGQIWDGYSCLPQIPPSETVNVICPDYISRHDTMGQLELYAKATCTESAGWETYFDGDVVGIADYKQCLTGQLRWDQQLNTFKVISESLSAIALATSIFCFLYCRRLRIQPVYQIHLQMFISMFLYFISCLLRDTLVNQFMLTNSYPPGCELISVFVRLFMLSTYASMSVEAFYLHWHLTHPLVRKYKHLRRLFIFVGSVPLTIITVYSALRLEIGNDYGDANKFCWINPWSFFEWIFIYGPNALSWVMNLIFLVDCFRITCRMQPVAITGDRLKRRRSSGTASRCEIWHRREFRAMLTFAFLFGIPKAPMFIRKTSLKGIRFKILEATSVALQALQGVFVSVLLCYLNVEVRQELRRSTIFYATRESVSAVEGAVRTVRTYSMSKSNRSRLKSPESATSPVQHTMLEQAIENAKKSKSAPNFSLQLTPEHSPDEKLLQGETDL